MTTEIIQKETSPIEPSQEYHTPSEKTSTALPLAYTPLPRSLILTLALCLALAIIGGYWWTRPKQSAGIENAKIPESAAKAGVDPEKVEGMAKSLATRLKANPQDAAGWSMLARTYSVVGRTTEAVDAYAHAVELSAEDAALIVDYADALAAKNNQSFDGEPLRLLQRALKIDPRNLKGLAISGKYSFDQKDYAAAVRQWEQVIQLGTPDNLFVKQIQSQIMVARELAGMPQKGALKQEPKTQLGIGGMVSLSGTLVANAVPQDTVFVTVRMLDGPRLPLAIFKKQVKDLPFPFQIDESTAKSPGASANAAGRFVISARIAKSGSATPRAGDLVGQVGPVDSGSTGIILEIRDTYKP
jgi:cytochrome c-type biogenesis protein CcmH